MIVFNDETLLVHNPKTAGTSLITYLLSNLPGPVHTAGVRQLGTYHPSLSMSMGYAAAVVGTMSFKRVISVIRNPFDREVSMYLYYRNVLASSATLKDDLRDETMRQRVMKAAELDFRSYLRWIWDRDGTVDIWRSWCFYQLADGTKLDTLCILRFENLDSELANALGVPTVNLPRLNTSSRHPTAAYYDKRSARIVRRSYNWMFAEGYYGKVDCPIRGSRSLFDAARSVASGGLSLRGKRSLGNGAR